MEYKRIFDPVCGIAIHLLVSTPDELGLWLNKHEHMTANAPLVLHASAAVLSTINDDNEPLVWFRAANDEYGIDLASVAHEVFHLWACMKSKMSMEDNIRVDVTNAEYDTYHYEHLFSAVAEFTFNAYNGNIRFPGKLKKKKGGVPAIVDTIEQMKKDKAEKQITEE